METARDWEVRMQEALDQARLAERQGEVPVGALILDGRGNCLAKGYNAPIAGHDPTAHAEIVALRRAAHQAGNYRLGGAVLVTTLEPCLMCVGALIQSRVAGVVFGTRDEKAGAVVSQADFPASFPWINHTFWVLEGICRHECRDLLQEFFAHRRDAKRRGSEVRS